MQLFTTYPINNINPTGRATNMKNNKAIKSKSFNQYIFSPFRKYIIKIIIRGAYENIK